MTAVTLDTASPSSVSDTPFTTNSTQASGSFTPPSDTLVVVAVVLGTSSTFATSPTVSVADSLSNSYTLDTSGSEVYVSERLYLGYFYKYYTSSPGAITVTATRSPANEALFLIMPYVLDNASSSGSPIGSYITSSTAVNASLDPSQTGSFACVIGIAYGATSGMSRESNTTVFNFIGDGTDNVEGYAGYLTANTTASTPVTLGSSGGSYSEWACSAIEIIGGPPPLSVTTTSLPNGYPGESYSQTLVATGGSGSGYTWTISSGSLPGWASQSGTGDDVISGTVPGVATAVDFTVKVTDSASNTATQALSITVPAVTGGPLDGTVRFSAPTIIPSRPIVIQSAPAAGSGLVGTPNGTITLSPTTVGNTIYVVVNPYSTIGSNASVTLGSTTVPLVAHYVSGGLNALIFAVEDTIGGNTTVSITTTGGVADTFGFALEVNGASPIVDQFSGAVSGTDGTTISTGTTASLAATGEFVLAMFGTEDSAITPPASGYTNIASYADYFEVGYADSASTSGVVYAGTQATSNGTFIGLIAAFLGLTITTSSLPIAYNTYPYSTTLEATGLSGTTTSFTWTVTSGSLPTGLSLAGSTGVISGTPSGGTSSTALTFKITDAENNTATKSLTLTVDPLPPDSLSAAIPLTAQVGFIPGSVVSEISTSTSASITTTVLDGSVSFPASSRRADVKLTEGPLSKSATFPSATILAVTKVTTSALDCSVTFPSRTIRQDQRPTTTALDGSVSFPSCTILAVTKVTTSVLDCSVSFPSATVTTALNASITTTVLDTSVSFPSSTILAVIGVTTTALDGSVSFPSASILAVKNITTAVLDGSVSFPAVSPRADAKLIEGPLDGTVSFPSPTIHQSQKLTTTVLGGSVSFPAPTISTVSLPSIIQTAPAAGSGYLGTTSGTITFTNNTAAGNIVYVCIFSYISSNEVSVTLGTGDISVPQVATNYSSAHTNEALYIFAVQDVLGGNKVINITDTGATYTFGFALEIKNASAIVDQSAGSASGTASDSWSSGDTADLAAASEFLLGLCGAISGYAITGPSGGWTNIAAYADWFEVGYAASVGTGELAYAGSQASAGYAGALITAFKLPASSHITASSLDGTVSFPSATLLAVTKVVPTYLACSVSFPSASVTTSTNASITTTVLDASVSFTSATIHAGQTATTTVLDGTISFPSPAILDVTGVTTSALDCSSSFPSTTIHAAQVVTTAVLDGSVTFPSASILAVTEVTTTALDCSVSFPGVSLHTGETVTTSALDVSASFPSASISAGGSASVTTTILDGSVSFSSASILTQVELVAGDLAASTSFPAPSISAASGNADITTTVLDCSTSFPAASYQASSVNLAVNPVEVEVSFPASGINYPFVVQYTPAGTDTLLDADSGTITFADYTTAGNIIYVCVFGYQSESNIVVTLGTGDIPVPQVATYSTSCYDTSLVLYVFAVQDINGNNQVINLTYDTGATQTFAIAFEVNNASTTVDQYSGGNSTGGGGYFVSSENTAAIVYGEFVLGLIGAINSTYIDHVHDDGTGWTNIAAYPTDAGVGFEIGYNVSNYASLIEPYGVISYWGYLSGDAAAGALVVAFEPPASSNTIITTLDTAIAFPAPCVVDQLIVTPEFYCSVSFPSVSFVIGTTVIIFAGVGSPEIYTDVTFPAPSFQADANLTTTVLDTSVIFGQQAGSSSYITTAALDGSVSFSNPAIHQSQELSTSVLITSVSFPAVSIHTNDNFTTLVLDGSVSFPAATIHQSQEPTTTALHTSVTFPTASIHEINSVTITALDGSVSFPAPTISGKTVVVPSTIDASVTFPAAGIHQSQLPTTAVLTTGVSFPSAGILAVTRVTTSVLDNSVTFPSTTITERTAVTTAVLSTSVTFPAVVIKIEDHLTTEVLSASVSFAASTVNDAKTVTPSVLDGSVSFSSAAVHQGQTVTTSVLHTSVSFAESINASSKPTPSALDTSVTFPSATITSGESAVITPSALGTSVSFSAVHIKQGQDLPTPVFHTSVSFPSPRFEQEQTVFPPQLHTSVSFPAAIVEQSKTVTTTVLDGSVSFSNPKVTVKVFVTSAVLDGSVAFPSETVVHQGQIAPARSLTTSVRFPAVQINEGQGIPVPVLLISAEFNAAFAHFGSGINTTVLDGLVTFSSATPNMGFGTYPNALHTSVTFPTLGIVVGQFPEPGLLLTEVTFPTVSGGVGNYLTTVVVDTSVTFPESSIVWTGSPRIAHPPALYLEVEFSYLEINFGPPLINELLGGSWIN